MRRCTFYAPNVPSDSFLTTSSCSDRHPFHHTRDLYALRWDLDNSGPANRCHIAARKGGTTHLLARTSQAAAHHSVLRTSSSSFAKHDDPSCEGAPPFGTPYRAVRAGWWDCCFAACVFEHFAGLGVGSGKVALSRSGRAPKCVPNPTPLDRACRDHQRVPQTVWRFAKFEKGGFLVLTKQKACSMIS